MTKCETWTSESIRQAEAAIDRFQDRLERLTGDFAADADCIESEHVICAEAKLLGDEASTVAADALYTATAHCPDEQVQAARRAYSDAKGKQDG